MIRAIIVDDEQYSIDRLTFLIGKYCSRDINVVGACQSVEEGLKVITDKKPDLVFLDVQMGSHTGFDLLRKLEHIDFEIIFITAHEKYAVQAFRFSAFDYLLKPVDENDFNQTIVKLKRKFSRSEQARKIDTLFHNLQHISNASRRLSIPLHDGLIFPEVKDIVRCESIGNYTLIFLNDGKKFTASRPLKKYEEMLEDCNFFRVHQSHLINLAYVKSYQRGKGGMVTLTDETEIEVSVRRKDEFLKRVTEM